MEWNLILEKQFGTLSVCDNNDSDLPVYIKQESNVGDFADMELTEEEAEGLVDAIFSILNLDKYKKKW